VSQIKGRGPTHLLRLSIVAAVHQRRDVLEHDLHSHGRDVALDGKGVCGSVRGGDCGWQGHRQVPTIQIPQIVGAREMSRLLQHLRHDQALGHEVRPEVVASADGCREIGHGEQDVGRGELDHEGVAGRVMQLGSA
jgi:hypothetical protein